MGRDPADVKKEGPAYDLPIAVGILVSSGQLDTQPPQSVFLGELSLDGNLRHTNGILPMVALARDRELGTAYVPEMNAKEASLVDGVEVLPVRSLPQLVAHLRGEALIPPFHRQEGEAIAGEMGWSGVDLSHIRGQEHAKRALEVAASLAPGRSP